MSGFVNLLFGGGGEVDERCQKPRDRPRKHLQQGYSLNETWLAQQNAGGDHFSYEAQHGYRTYEAASGSQNEQHKEPLHRLRSQAPQTHGIDEEVSKQQRRLFSWRKQMPLSPLDSEISKLFSELLLKVAYLRNESSRMEEIAGAAEQNSLNLQKKLEQFQPEDEFMTAGRKQESASKQSKGNRLWKLKLPKRNTGAAVSADVWGSRVQVSNESWMSPLSGAQAEGLDEMALKDEEERSPVSAHNHSTTLGAILQVNNVLQQAQHLDGTNPFPHGRGVNWGSWGEENFEQISAAYPVAHRGSEGQGRSYLVEDPIGTVGYPSIKGVYDGDLYAPGNQSDYGAHNHTVSHKLFSRYQALKQLVKQHQDKEQQVFAELQARSVKTSEIGSSIIVLHDKLRSVLVEAHLVVPKMRLPELDSSNLYDGGETTDELCKILWKEYMLVDEQKMRYGEALKEYEAEQEHLRDHMLAERVSKNQEIARLSELLKTLEQENAKSSQNGSYVDTAATPPLLDDHVITVKELLVKFARIYDKTMTEAGLSISMPSDDSENCGLIDHMHFARKSHGPKFRAAYLISTAMFRGFEIDGFDTERGYFCPTLDLEESHAACFKEFQDLKSIDILQVMPNLEADAGRSRSAHRLLRFFRRTFEYITPQEIQGQCWHRDHPFFKNFVPLAAAVWALQRLTMSFEPNARIFRVTSGMEYDEQYMSNVVGEDEEDGDSVFLPKVGLMVVPGFRVGKIIIKSLVYLQCNGENS